jgi:hypothetical protein
VYSLGTLFVSGIYVQIPCIKEIMMTLIIIIIIITIINSLLRNLIKKEAEKIPEYKDVNSNRVHVE